MFSSFFKNGLPIPFDFIVLAGILILFFAYVMYFGKNKIISAILAFYPAQFIYSNATFLDKFLVLKGDYLLTINKIFLFLIIFFPINIIIGRYIFSDSGFGSGKALRSAGLAITALIVLLVFWYSVVNLDAFYNFSSQIDGAFSKSNIFYWNLAPFVLLYFL